MSYVLPASIDIFLHYNSAWAHQILGQYLALTTQTWKMQFIIKQIT